jgi:4a-hydroxytetrahydrobiopterin dehydratase
MPSAYSEEAVHERAGAPAPRREAQLQNVHTLKLAAAILRSVPLEPPERWEEVEGALQREFRFKDFAQAIDFVNRVAEIAEKAHHHPDIAVHWNHVTLRWWTHTSDAITDRDIKLAARTNGLV